MNIVGIIILVIIGLFGIQGMKAGLVRKFSGLLALILSCVLVGLLLPVTVQVLKEKTPVYDVLADQGKRLVSDRLEKSVPADSLSKVEQTKLIKTLPLPAFVQRMMVNFNNRDGYKTLGVENFTDYLVGFVVSMLVNIIAFFVTMLLAWLVIRGIIAALDLCARIPFLYSANRLGGLVVGLAEGLFFIWLLLLIISMFSGTETGAKILGMVSENTALAPILEWNIFLRIVTGAITRIM